MLPRIPSCLRCASRAPRFLAPALAAFLLAASTSLGAVPQGFIDVTAYGAIPDDGVDDTAAIQAAINDGRDQDIAVWFPGGDYWISDRLEADQEPNNTDNAPIVLRGSTVNPQNRARLILKANSPGFDDPGNRKVMLHFFNGGTAESESGNANLFNHGAIGLDLKIESGNPGAIALRMQGAEGCSIQDVNIDLTEGGHTGIWGIPGSGGSTHEITITGGRIGIDTRLASGAGGGSQPGPVVTGATLLDQSECAVFATTRGPLVMVGAVIKRDSPGPIFKSLYNWQGQPFDGSLQLVDCRLEYASYDPGNVLIKEEGVRGRSFHLDNTYLLHGEKLWSGGLAANPGGWRHYARVAQVIDAQSRNWADGKDPEEPVWLDGVEQGKTYNDSADSGAPPADLQSRHQWPEDFPTWEHPGVVDVTTLGAVGDNATDNHAVLQQAIDNHEIIFIPGGKFRISDTLELKPDTKIIGVHHKMSILRAISTKSNRFGGITSGSEPDKPMIRTADTADAQTWIAGLHIRRETPLAQHDPTPTANYALEWRSGGESLLRMVDFDGTTATNLRPDFIASNFYGFSFTPDPNHPQQDFPSGTWAWPVKSPTVQVRGNGGGKVFGFWLHGRQGLRETTPFIRVENTSQPIHFYHFHIQQQDSENFAEFINAHNVSVYGSKEEGKGTFAYFEDSTNIRYYGHTGISGVDHNHFDPYQFRFINCDDFLIAGINDTITEWSSGTKWIGGAYDRWLRNHIKNWNPILDQSSSRPDVISPWWQRPIVYLRGNPAYVPHAAFTGGGSGGSGTLISDNFDDNNLDGWSVDEGGGTVSVSNGEVHLNDTVNGASVDLFQDIAPQTGAFTVEADIKLEAPGGWQHIRLYDSSGTIGVDVEFENNDIELKQPSFDQDIGDYDHLVWFKVRLEVDAAAQTVDVFLNGSPTAAITGGAFFNQVSEISRVQFNTGFSPKQDMWVDNVTVTGSGGGTQPPAAPSGLTASNPSSSTVDLDWTDNSANEDEFVLDFRQSGGSWQLYNSVPADTVAVTATGLSASTGYDFRVRAGNAAGDSAWSNTASATTTAGSGGGELIVDNFDDNNLDGWSVDEGGGTVSVSNGEAHLEDTVNGASVDLFQDIAPQTGAFTVEADIKLEAPGGWQHIRLLDGSGTIGVDVEFENNDIELKQPSFDQDIGDYGHLVWFKVRLEVDVAAQTVDVFLNGSPTAAITGGAFFNQVSEISRVQFNTGFSPRLDMWVDNVFVAGQSNALISDQFDTDLSAWTLEQSGGSVTLVGGEAFLEDNISGDAIKMRQSFAPQSGSLTLETSVRVEGSSGWQHIRLNDGSGTTGVDILFKNNDVLLRSGWDVDVGDFTGSNPIPIRLEIDIPAQTADIYLDGSGTPSATGVAFFNAVSELSELEFTTGGNPKLDMWVDYAELNAN